MAVDMAEITVAAVMEEATEAVMAETMAALET